MRMIDADALIEDIDGDLTDSIAEGRAIEKIMNAPTIEPKKGKWIPSVDKWGDIVTTVDGYTCSDCGSFNVDKDDFCPNCGADMRGEQ